MKSLPFSLEGNPNGAVFVPQFGAYGSPSPALTNQNKLDSCLQCQYWKSTSHVEAAHPEIQGYGACNIMGLLVDTELDQHLEKAPKCFLATEWQPSLEVPVAPLRPPYSGEEVPVITHEEDDDDEDDTPVVAPKPHVSGRKVTAWEADQGVDHWEEIEAPEGGKSSAWMPVFADHLWSDVERAMIPQAGDPDNPVELYEDHKNLLWRLLVNHEDNLALNMLGDAGVGKTEFARWAAFRMQIPFERVNFSEQSEKSDVIGTPGYKDGEGTVWNLGSVARAITRPFALLLDEVSVAPPVVEQVLRSLLDGSRTLNIQEEGGITLVRHPLNFLMEASNPAWDARYVGAQDTNAAANDRMAHVWIPYPPRDVERRIINNACKAKGYKIDSKLITTLLDISKDIRAACDPIQGGELDTAWGIRSNINAAKLTRRMKLEMVYETLLGARLEPSGRLVIENIVKTYTAGTEL